MKAIIAGAQGLHNTSQTVCLTLWLGHYADPFINVLRITVEEITIKKCLPLLSETPLFDKILHLAGCTSTKREKVSWDLLGIP